MVTFLRLLLAINRYDCTFFRLLLAINRHVCTFLRILLAMNRHDCTFLRLLLAINCHDYEQLFAHTLLRIANQCLRRNPVENRVLVTLYLDLRVAKIAFLSPKISQKLYLDLQ